ncbi:MAG: DUF1624 domain-containing protein [Bacteroidia bacterium]|nr:DUF1624 domain-containing protein [Bacteroidia bacterium]
MTTAASLQQPKASYRIDSIDLLRGLVMVIMALDHTRDFFHKDVWSDDPLNLATTTTFLYFTRWITHFCAPVFVFLAGSSAWFQSLRKSKRELSGFLISRGLWLVFIEVFVINFAFFFDVHYSLIALQTIWSIGISMIVLGLVIWLPFAIIAALGLIIVFGHNSLDYYEANMKSSPGWFYDMLHNGGMYKLWDHHSVLFFYPFLSWAGLMMLGYCFGKLFTSYQGIQRKKILIGLGIGTILFFITLRTINGYGNPEHWSTQKDWLHTFLSFMDVHKYPPSLLYTCATIGPAILFLAFAGNIKNRLTKFITAYGRVPFLYYVLHFFLIHILSAIFFLTRGHSFAEGLKDQPGVLPKFIIPGEGYSLWVVYAVWIFVVLSLYPVCKWFSDYKLAHKEKKWLSYL